MRFALLTLVLAACSWPESPEPPPTPVPETATIADAPIANRGACVYAPTANGDALRLSIPGSGPAVVLPKADDWRSDCTQSTDPDGNSQFLSAVSENTDSSAYILSLDGSLDADSQGMLEVALAEMRQVWEMHGSVEVDQPFPSRPVAVLRATDNESGEDTWQVVTVSKSPDGGWVRIHQTWSCNACGLDGIGTKSVIDAMVSASSGWGFSE
ncbi:MAG: hypothetical protein ACJATT_005522 [Myxococcota bacterium]|jgi:hypothetical protein